MRALDILIPKSLVFGYGATMVNRSMNYLSESEIRQFLRHCARRLLVSESDTLLVEEFAVDGGRNRIDMLLVGNETVGIEIKSARDNLSRLPAQANSFSRYFDYMILVTDSKFVEPATKFLPEWWGIVEISNSTGRTRLAKIREPLRNPAQVSKNLLEFLWKSELLSLLDRAQQTTANKRRAKKTLRDDLACSVNADDLRTWSLDAILGRQNWRGVRLQKAS